MLVVIDMFKGDSKPSTDPTSGRPTGMSEADYNYVNGRTRREGMNAKETDEATRAVLQYEQARRTREGR